MAFEIPIDVSKFAALAKEIDKSADAVERLAGKVDDLNGRMGQTVTAGGRVVAAAPNPRTISALPRKPFEGELEFIGPVRPPKPIETTRGTGRVYDLDPYSREGVRDRLDREASMLERAKATGDDKLIRDQQNRVLTAQKAVDRAERALGGPKSRDEILEDILNTSRIGAGGKLFPLVGKLRQLQTLEGADAAASTLQGLGIGAGKSAAELSGGIMGFAGKALPSLLTGLGVAAGGAALYGVAEAGDERMRKTNAAFYTMGGSPTSVGEAMALGGENAGAKAMAFGDRLRQGSYGSAFMHAQGIYDMGPMQTDKSSNYVLGIDALRGIKDDQEAIRVARDTGLTDDLWTRKLNAQTFGELRRSIGNAGSPEELKSEAEYRAGKEMFGNSMNKLWRAVSKPVMAPVGAAVRALADPIGETFSPEAVTDLFSARSLFGESVGDWWDKKTEGTWWGKNSGVPGKKGAGKAMRGGWKDIDPAIGDSPNTINGTTAGAIPVGFRGKALNSDLDRLNQMIGAF